MQGHQNCVAHLPKRPRLARTTGRNRPSGYHQGNWWTAKGTQREIYSQATIERVKKARPERARPHYLYLLRDPRDGVIRYIGISYHPARRIYQHAGRLSSCRQWIAELRNDGLRPILETPFGALHFGAAKAAEERLIAMHSIAFPGQLLNRQHCVTSFFGRLSPISIIFREGGFIFSPISNKVSLS